jgi:hypothetical protein
MTNRGVQSFSGIDSRGVARLGLKNQFRPGVHSKKSQRFSVQTFKPEFAS